MRAYVGCRLLDILIDQNTPRLVLFYELWDSRRHQEKYLAWRTETGLMEKPAPFLTAARQSVISISSKIKHVAACTLRTRCAKWATINVEFCLVRLASN